MNSFWKGVSLTIILFFALIIVYNIFNSPHLAPQKQNGYQHQVDMYEQQVKKNIELQLETKRQLEESARLQGLQKINVERMSNILDRWEKQADRYDAILNNWEKEKIY